MFPDTVTIQIPDDVAHGLECLASSYKMTVEQLAADTLLRLSGEPTDSPAALLRALRSLPHPSPEAVDELEAAIASARIQMGHSVTFEPFIPE
jgi:hypothetical protein